MSLRILLNHNDMHIEKSRKLCLGDEKSYGAVFFRLLPEKPSEDQG